MPMPVFADALPAAIEVERDLDARLFRLAQDVAPCGLIDARSVLIDGASGRRAPRPMHGA